MKKVSIITFALSAASAFAQNSIDLRGQWAFQTDKDNRGIAEQWYAPGHAFNDNILLPASMPQRLKGDAVTVNTQWVGALYDSSYYRNPYMEKYRQESNLKVPFFLTPDRHYVGKAWYRKTINIDKVTYDDGTPIDYELYLERPHIATMVWVNGQRIAVTDSLPSAQQNMRNTLSVPHVFSLGGALQKGDNTIVICVDNTPDVAKVGNDSHSVTDQTQGDWNGIVGKMELRQRSYIDLLRVFPDIDNRKATVKLRLHGFGKAEKATLKLVAESFNTATRHIVTPKPVTVMLPAEGVLEQDVVLDMGDGMLLWDEFSPQMYRLATEVTTATTSFTQETFFGMRKIEARGKMFYVNGREVQLRGTVENCCFPDTGYPPTDVDSWLRIFEKCKLWGLNHMRFHTYCPPEAAFLAADLTGFYIQPEGPSWPNHGVKLGRGEYIDNYLYDEAVRIMDTYGNHPSFTFFAFGNEPAGNWVKWSNDHTPRIAAYDPRHINCGFSVGGGWAWQPKVEYAVKAGARGLSEWVRTAPESMGVFTDKVNTYNGKDMPGTPITFPFVSHETGQWCAFPNFAEIDKYKGVNKAGNFEIFRDLLRDNGMERRGRDFLMASGKLQALCYKYEIERHLRTPNYAGFQLLALNDYSGQGSAIVGLTDVFFDEKGYINDREFREFCSPVVPIANFPKFTYLDSETFSADIELSQFSEGTLTGVTPVWTVTKSDGTLLSEGTLPKQDLPVGQNLRLGNVSVPLSSVDKAMKLTLTVSLPSVRRYSYAQKDNVIVQNHWDFWVYPSIVEDYAVKQGKRPGTYFDGDIYVTDSLDAQAQKLLKKGGKVLICAAGKVSYGKEVKQQFTPVFWNTSWFKMRPPHTTGIFVEEKHPVFDDFPTDYHSDLQWWELVNKAQVMQFTDFPHDFQPLVQSIDTWFVSRKIGMLFEARVGRGRLMMTSMDISRDLDKRHAARQMRSSIMRYMHSEFFQPQWTIDKERIADLFTKVAGEVNMYTNDSPDELKPTLIAK